MRRGSWIVVRTVSKPSSNIAEGVSGISREAEIPTLLEKLQIPYTGSGPDTLRHCLDKDKTKQILKSHNLPVPWGIVATIPWKTLEFNKGMRYPVMLKPLYEGSSKGINNDNLVKDDQALFQKTQLLSEKWKQPILIEQFLSGREFTVALIGNPPNLRVLPIVEINFTMLPEEANPIYSFEAKWIWDTVEKPLEIFMCPAKISKSLQNEIENLAKKTFEVLECRDWARLDFRCDAEGKVHVLEVNPLPGIIPDPSANSCFPKAARAVGWDYRDLIREVLKAAMARYGEYCV
jgi:D-alanine-D-alanine ligase